MATFTVLPGPPPYGPAPEPFSPTGMGKHREGVVVQFSPGDGSEWVGNFQRGLTSFNSVLAWPEGQQVVVIAGGQGYVVDAYDRSCLETFGGQITEALQPSAGVVVLCSLTAMQAFGPQGRLWQTRRISWDGFRALRIEGERILGESWRPFGEHWVPFAVRVSTGEVEGGAFEDGQR